MGIIGDFFRALGQIGDPRFLRVLLIGLGLTLALLFGVYAAFLTVMQWIIPEAITLPFIGPVSWVDNVVSWASLPLMMVLSVFLMVPVASVFTSLFLDDVADAVEARHYPYLDPAARLGVGESIVLSLRFLGLLVLANLLALTLYLFFPPFAPFIFWSLNGFLLGREYFQLIAIRRLGREGALAMRRKHGLTIWLAGGLMAILLTFPLINLLVPVLGAATFTHLFHRLDARAAAP